MKLRTLQPLLALAGLGLAAGAAQATSSAWLQVTSFSVQVNGGSLLWSAPDAYQTLQASAADTGGLADYDSSSSTSFSLASGAQAAGTAHGGATAWATGGQTLGALASALSGGGWAYSQPNSGLAIAGQSDAFTLQGASSVTFKVGYVLNVSAIGGNAIDDYGWAALSLSAGSYLGDGGGTAAVSHASFNELTGIGTHSGQLSLTVQLNGADDIGWYSLSAQAQAFAPAAVPEPSQAALLLAGLLAIGGTALRRRG